MKIKEKNANTLKDMIKKLEQKLSLSSKKGLQKILTIEKEEMRRKKLLQFLTELYPDAGKSHINSIKNIYILLADNSKEADEISEQIAQYLNHPAQFKRITALNIIYHFYYNNFTPSPETIKILSTALTDCLSISAEVSQKINLSRGYKLLKFLADIYPDEILPLVYDALKEKKTSLQNKIYGIIRKCQVRRTFMGREA